MDADVQHECWTTRYIDKDRIVRRTTEKTASLSEPGYTTDAVLHDIEVIDSVKIW